MKMRKLKTKTIKIQTGINPVFLEGTLTEDISPLESLFDLIDNSIDAARNHLLKFKPKLDEYGLPSNYSDYSIHIRIDNDSIRILDNCLGIEEATLSDKALYIAETSNHNFGIGHYGLGLKRALLKFGYDYALATDDGSNIFRMKFNNKSFGSGDRNQLTADAFPSNGKRMALFSVSNLKTEVKYEISSDRWFEYAIRELSVRYAVYVSKGIKISVRSILHHKFEKINSILPKLRTNGKFPPTKNIPLEIDDVHIYIESGIHDQYLFPGEKGHSISENRKLTKSFGLYFICNDRVIVANSLSPNHGWKTTWHSEYNGFVCLVRFVSASARKMPWNTAKTAIRTDSTIFLKVRDQLQPIADLYRKDIRKRYGPKKSKSDYESKHFDIEAKPIKLGPSTDTQYIAPTKLVKPFSRAIDNQHLHVKNWLTLLPKDFPHSDDNLLNALIIESVSIQISDAPYAASMLYRALMEAALKRFVHKTDNYKNVKIHFYSSSEGKKKNHSEEQKKAQGISPPIILPWLGDNTILFNEENKSRLINATKKTKLHMPYLNGVVHGNQLMDGNKLTIIRNETVDLLQFLTTKNIVSI